MTSTATPPVMIQVMRLRCCKVNSPESLLQQMAVRKLATSPGRGSG
jgi:hypothetical protein